MMSFFKRGSLFDIDLRMPNITLRRVVHPVGQGAFYTEEFFSDAECIYTVVYDCGAETNQDVLSKTIEEFKERIREKGIDLLFISHFHADHINGLDYLLKDVTVKKTVIPMLPPEVVLLTRVQNFIKYRGEAMSSDMIISDLYLEGKNRSRFGSIIAIAPNNLSNNSPLLPLRNEETHPNASVIDDAEPLWEYVPFNSVDIADNRAQAFADGLRRIPGAIDNKGRLDVNSLVYGSRSKVKELYHRVMKGANDNLYTLIVESRPSKTIDAKTNPALSSCLYLGDFDSRNKEDVWERFSGVFSLSDVGTIQIPHHGSRDSWRDELLLETSRFYFVSTGSNNNYHHPDFWVIKSLIDAKHSVSIVNEVASSKKEYGFTIMSDTSAN